MDLLQDPKHDRAVPSLPGPPHRPLSTELLYPENLHGKPNWRLLKDHLFKEGKLQKESVIQLVNQCSKILKNEGNVLQIQDPLTVVGDIHGQFYDLITILNMGGDPEHSKYLFLGDLVDRGSFSIECVCLLYAMKIYYPKEIYFLRGNHECRQMTSHFNFKDECNYKFDQDIYDAIMDSFDNFPLAAVINDKFICVHGGISPEFQTITDIDRLDRFKEPPKNGLFCDLLWADPIENENAYQEIQYKGNDIRCCSWFFGERAIAPLLAKNNYLCLIRGHEVQLDGYKLHHYNEKTKDFPQVVTVFSAPNYCDTYGNLAAIIKFDNGVINIEQFAYASHPYLLPHFLDIFSWSIPFVSEKVTEMLHYVMTPKPGEKELDSDPEGEKEVIKMASLKDQDFLQQKQRQIDVAKRKIKFVGKMMLMQRTLRENNENIIKLKGLCPDNKIPRGVLLQGTEGIIDAISQFNKVRDADRINEKRPVQ